MSSFDALLDKVWQLARDDPDFLTSFSHSTDDRVRVEKILALPELESLQVKDSFSGKSGTRAEGRDLGEINTVIRHAPTGSSQLAQSYASRSKVLLESGHPDLALKDTKRALALPLSQHDTVKLLCLTAACHQEIGCAKLAEQNLNEALAMLKQSDLENDLKTSIAGEIIPQLKKKQHQQQKPKRAPDPGAALPQLTYGKNATIPAASTALKLCESAEKGRYMVATRDIKPGSVLIVEQPYAWTLSEAGLSEHCLHCCGYVLAPVPCSQCVTVSYCSDACRDAAWLEYHHQECSILDHILKSTQLSKMAWLVYRIVLKAMVSNTDVASSFSPKPFCSNDYATVWGQVTHAISRTPADVLKRTTSAIFLASLLRHVTPKEIDLVRIAALMLRHLQSCSCNAYQITEQVVPQGDVKRSMGTEIGGAVYPTISLCNHSCNPNVARHCLGFSCIVRAVRNIKKGDEILDNYGPHFLSDSLEERQRLLNSQYFFTCSCEACFNNWSTAEQLNPSNIKYKCAHCSAVLGTTLNGLKVCPHCKTKFDFHKVGKRLEFLSREYTKALENLVQKKYNSCLKTCVEYCDVMDSVTVHPNKQFVSCQQAITLCWSLIGNVRNVL